MSRLSSWALCLTLGLGAGVGCKQREEPVTPAASEPIAVAPGGAPPKAQVVEKVDVRLSLAGLEDLIDAAWTIATQVDPELGATRPMDQVQGMLLQFGFAPGFMTNLDLDGRHVVSASMPVADNPAPTDFDLSGSIAVVDGRRLIEAVPANIRPQPVGEGVWEVAMPPQRLLLREQGRELLFGLTQSDLERATGLRSSFETSRRVRVDLDNLKPEMMENFSLGDSPIEKTIENVTKQAESVRLEGDFGMKRDLEGLLTAVAPFERLGLDHFGSPRGTPSGVEKVLPPEPLMAVTLSWGDPKQLHAMIDRSIPKDAIPAPFADRASKALKSAHGILDGVSDDIVAAIYADAKGRGTIVLAATAKDDAAMKQTMRSVHEVLADALEFLSDMQGKNERAKFGVQFKPDGLRARSRKADHLSIRLPKEMIEEESPLLLFSDGKAVDVVTLAEGGVAWMAIGPGAKSLAGDFVGRTSGDAGESLAADPSLAKLRQSMGGCQLCVTFDLRAYLEMRLRAMSREKDKPMAKASAALLKDGASAIGKDQALGASTLGVDLGQRQAKLGFIVPATTLFASGEALRWLQRSSVFVFDGTLPETTTPTQ